MVKLHQHLRPGRYPSPDLHKQSEWQAAHLAPDPSVAVQLLDQQQRLKSAASQKTFCLIKKKNEFNVQINKHRWVPITTRDPKLLLSVQNTHKKCELWEETDVATNILPATPADFCALSVC